MKKKWELTIQPNSLADYKANSEYMEAIRHNIYKMKVDKDYTNTTKVWRMPAGKSSSEQNVLTKVGAAYIIREMELDDIYQLVSQQNNYVVFECRLIDKNGTMVRQGFGGGSSRPNDDKDFNKGIQMAQKRALVKAVMDLTKLYKKGWTTDMEPEVQEILKKENMLDEKYVNHIVAIYNALKLKKGEQDIETGKWSNEDFEFVGNEIAILKRTYNVAQNSIKAIISSISETDYYYLISMFSSKNIFNKYGLKDSV